MQDIIAAIIRNRNLLNKQFAAVESELDYLYLEGDYVAIQAELDLIECELVKASFVNCTPHHLTIEGIGELPPSGILPRVTTDYYAYGLSINGVRVRQNSNGVGSVTGLPAPVEGLNYIVSGMVRDALSSLPDHLQRPDVFAPDTGSDAIRNDDGQIVAVRGLVQ